MGLKRDILIGLAVIGTILIILSVIVGIIILLTKAIGLLMILAAVFLIVFFPDIGESQPQSMSKTGIVLGFILLIAGILLILL